MTQRRALLMTINLNVLDHLGMNLYSTMPAVLSEIVANAWDADAENVNIRLDKADDVVVIQDDGIGMTRDHVVERFLTVGYRRRNPDELPKTERLSRRPMGRKGIGKLSSFSIARVVTVYTARDGERTAFRMDADEIREKIKQEDDGVYSPAELCTSESAKVFHDIGLSGTRIELRGLKRKLRQSTQTGLRRRVARRFSVIGRRNSFSVRVDGEEIQPADRGYNEHVEYVWTYNAKPETVPNFPKLAEGRKEEDRTHQALTAMQKSGEDSPIRISGWIGTVKQPKSLTSEEGDNLNRIAIFMRGKLAQEDILRGFAQKEIYADYVVGEIHCDDLDDDDGDDIATSSRQELKQDDPRFETLRKIIRSELRYIAAQWSKLRASAGIRELGDAVPEVKEWLEGLEGDTKGKAARWIGRINRIRSDDDRDKLELLKHSILAFESYRRKEKLDFLDKLDEDRAVERILAVFKDIDDLEISYYGQIVKQRLKIVETLSNKIDADKKEQVIQEYIYDHLWLLDPSWERVKGSEYAEKKLTKFLHEDTEGLSEEEKRARIDIGYRTTSGRHVIIELKRASVRVRTHDLIRQIDKYWNGANLLLEKLDHANWDLEIICLVGEKPEEWSNRRRREAAITSLGAMNARLVFYDELLNNTHRAYGDYLQQHEKIDKLWKIFRAIEDFGSRSGDRPVDAKSTKKKAE